MTPASGLSPNAIHLNVFQDDSTSETTKDSLEVRIETDAIPIKEFTEDLSEKYQGEDYEYDRFEGEAQNFITRFFNWFINKIAEIFGFTISPSMLVVLKIIFYGALGALVVYILVRLLVGENASAFFTRKSKMVAPLNIVEEHIENIDLDTYITTALEQKNYRLAIRYMYLKSLKLLSLNNIIEWHFEKTNSDYYTEIENQKLKTDFKKVSYLYDHIWYGEFELNEEGFYDAKRDFDRLTKETHHAR